jgi:hypothetical protein
LLLYIVAEIDPTEIEKVPFSNNTLGVEAAKVLAILHVLTEFYRSQH